MGICFYVLGIRIWFWCIGNKYSFVVLGIHVGPIFYVPRVRIIRIWCIGRKAAVFCVMRWNESGFRPLLCTYRLNWARRTSWGWWDDWDDTVLQTQDSKFEPWRSEAEHATSRSRRLPTIPTFTRGWGRNIFVSLKPLRPGTTTLGPRPFCVIGVHMWFWCTGGTYMV